MPITERIVVSGGSTYDLGTDMTYSVPAGTQNGGAVYVESEGMASGTNLKFTENGVTTADGKGGAIYNEGDIFLSGATFNGNNASQGSAVYNAGKLFMDGNIILATGTDTVYNAGSLIWDFTSNNTAKVTNYHYVTNAVDDQGKPTGIQGIWVDDEEATGSYVIASGDLSDYAINPAKYAFSISTDGESFAGLTLNNKVYFSNRCYTLAVTDADTKLTLTVEEGQAPGQRLVVEDGEWITIQEDTTYDFTSQPYYAGNGGIIEVLAGGSYTNNPTTVQQFIGGKSAGSDDPHDVGGCATYRSAGGAIYSEGYVKLVGATFADNRASGEHSGGAIYTSGKLILDSVFFYNNRSEQRDAGAICIAASDPEEGVYSVEISNTTFTNNYAEDDGGAIRLQEGTMKLINVSFSGNSCTVYGGAAIGIHNGTEAVIDQATFAKNVSANGGGAIINSSAELTITNTEFTGNKTNNGEGGAIKNGATLNLENVYFGDGTDAGKNTATNGGNAIYNTGTINLKGDVKLFTNETIYLVSGSKLNWVISDTDSTCGYLSDYSLIDGTTTVDTLTIDAKDALKSSYTLAGNASSAGGQEFTIITADETSQTIKVDDAAVTDSYGLTYTLATVEVAAGYDLVLSVSPSRVVVMEGGTVWPSAELIENATYTCPQLTVQKGGAVYNDGGTVTGSNVSFIGNTVTQESGGAIYIGNGGTVTLTGTATFIGNAATYNYKYGGAIYIKDGSLTIDGDAVFGNNASFSGGAICNEKTLTIDGNANFSGNTAKNGGAIDNYGTVSLSTVTFTGNSASSSGGAIYMEFGSTVTVTGDADFSNNVASTKGGAIYNKTSVTLNSATFSGNTASSGGAIYNETFASSTATVTISGNADFSNNVADTNGGAIYNGDYAGSTVTVSGDATFTGNSAADGGAIYNNGGTISFAGNSVSFTGNSASQQGGAISNTATVNFAGNSVSFSGNTAGKQGGAIYNEKTLTIDGNADFSGNIAKDGGAIYNNKGGSVSFAGTSISFTGNTATQSYGAICNNGGSISFAGDASFISNTAGNIGGAINNMNGEMTLSGNANFADNNAFQKGGAINNADSVNFNGASVTFSGNTAADGGAIYNNTGSVNFNGASVTFTGNTAGKQGGAIYNNGGSISFAGDADFSLNVAGGSGSAIYNNGSISFAKDVTFTGNTAGIEGGAIFNEGGTMNFAGSTTSFTGNTAKNGGAILNEGTLTLSNGVKFLNNSAGMSGGAFKDRAGTTTTISGNADFINNSARSGGAICISGTANFDDPNATLTFTGNTAGANGGAIMNDGVLTISGNAVFTDNTAGINGGGGAIYNEWLGQGAMNRMDFNGASVSFSGNTAGINGGAIFNKSSVLTISGDADFANNTSGKNGGAITNSFGTVTVSGNADFSLNVADEIGGAIYNFTGGSISFAKDVTFSGNSAAQGGAIYNTGGTIASVLNFNGASVTFSGNSAAQGGAIYNNDGTINLKGAMTLATASDTVVNGGTFNWDLSGGTASYAVLNGYQYYSNFGDSYKQTITVSDQINWGDTFTIATGDFSNLKDAESTFWFTGLEGQKEVSITIGDEKMTPVEYGSKKYQLYVNGNDLILRAGKPIEYTLSESVSTVYDGTAKTVSVTVTDPAVGASVKYSIDGGTTWYEGASCSITDAGSASVIFKLSAEDGYIETITEARTIDVAKRQVTITSGNTDQFDTYDGSEHFKKEVTVTSGSFAEGEGATYTDFATRIPVGSEDNTFVYTLNENTKAANYDITVVNGTVAVLPQPDDAVVPREKTIAVDQEYTAIAVTAEGSLNVNAGVTVTIDDTLTLNGGTVTNNGTVSVAKLVSTAEGSAISGELISAQEITVEQGASLALDKDQYDSFMVNSQFTADSTGKLVVEKSVGNSLTTKEIDALMAKENLSSVDFQQDLINVNKLNVKNTKSAVISFADGYGTTKSDTIRFYKNTNLSFGSEGGMISLEEGNNKIQIDKNATTAILSNLANVSKVKAASGSTVAVGDVAFQLGRSATLKTEGTSFTAGNVTGSDKSTTLTTGKETVFTALDLYAVSKINLGKYSTTQFGNVTGTQKISISDGKEGQIAVLTAANLTGTAKNDSYSLGNWNDVDFASLDFGDGNDTLKIGSYADVDITSLDFGEGAKDRLTIGKDSTLSVDTLDVASLDTLSMSSGSCLMIADAGDLADAKEKWSKYADQIISKLA